MPGSTTLTYNGYNLDNLGLISEITIMSQTGRMVPDKLAQKEIRQLKLRVEFFDQSYDMNMGLLTDARTAFATQNQEIIWTDPAGTIVLDRPVVIIAHDIPEDPNAWGTYNQQINITIEFEVDLTANDSGGTIYLQATFQQTGVAGQPANLGQIREFTQGYRSTKYSELRNIRERSSGTVNLKGEVFVGLTDTAGGNDNRRATLQAQLLILNAQVDGRDGTLTFGLPVNTAVSFFNQVVRIVSWEAHINQALNGIEWTMTADWTEFPNEASYAAADFKVERSEDRQTGEKVVRLSGTIGSPTPTIANAKLTLLMQTVIYNAQLSDQDAGWKGLAPHRFSSNPRYVNSDDTQGYGSAGSQQTMGTEDNKGNYTSQNVFMVMDFSVEWRKKSTNLMSWKMAISTQDDAATGIQRVTYSGSVVASGATPTAAWNAAGAQAAVLGDQKYPFRMSYSLVRNDRFTEMEGNPPLTFNPIIGLPATAGYIGAGIQEFVEMTFSYEYRVKGQRIYIEAKAEQTWPTFGENGMRVSGFVAAPDYATALVNYQEQVKALYLPNLVLDETLSQANDTIQTGAPYFGTASSFAGMFIRLDFSLSIWTPKPVGAFAIRFGIKVDLDYVTLRKTVNVDGTYWDTQANITAAENYVAGNLLDPFLATVMVGNKLSDSRTQAHDYLGTGSDFQQGLKFACVFVSVMTATQQILEMTVSEKIRYSGNRYKEFATVTGPSTIQGASGALGITMGTRMISCSVTCATEGAAMALIANIRQLAFPSGTNGAVATPATRYIEAPDVSTEFIFLPLTQTAGARGGTTNFQVCRKSFQISELLANSRYTDSGGTV
jgi:hypothetical protein